MSTDASEYDDARARIENMVGRIGGAWYEVIDALDENREGVFRLAERIGTNQNLDNPAAVFIGAIRKGQHNEGDRQSIEQAVPRTPREAFRGFFEEYREWMLDVQDADASLATERALDYAVGSMGSHSPRVHRQRIRISEYERGMTPITLEDEMRAELGQPRPVTTGDDRTSMGEHWKLVMLSLHDERIAAMFNALMDQCDIPREPTHWEARDALDALLAETIALGVKPRPPSSPPDVDGFDSVGGLLGAERYCRRGSKCLIATGGHGAALSPMQLDTRGLCLPCYEASRARA